MFNATCLFFVQQVFDEPLLLVLSLYCFYCTQISMSPPLIGGGIKQCFCLTSVCLSRTSGLSREQRGLGRPKLAQRWPTSHVTRIQLSRSPGRFTQRGLNALDGCSGQRGNVFGVGKYCYVASAWWRARRLGAHGERTGGILYCHAHSSFNNVRHSP